MRKALLLATFITVASALCLPGNASADSVTVQSPGPVNNGTSFTVDVNIANASNVFGFQLDLGFDPTLIQANGVTEGGFLPAGGSTFFLPGSIDNVGGTVAFNADVLFGPTPVSGSGLLLEFNFTAIAAGTSPLTLANILLTQPDPSDPTNPFLEITRSPDSSVNGSVTINPVISTPEPSVLVFLTIATLFFLIYRRAWRFV